jgi:quercetin dioxygenase-like cupin family protein
MFNKIMISLAALSLSAIPVLSQELAPKEARISVVFDRELPNVPGKSMKGVLVEYGPGGSSPAHVHPDSSFIYATVLEGEIESKVNDEPSRIFKAGENFAEVPGDHHGISANPSKTKSAKLLAVFVVDTDDKEIVIPDKH